MAPNLIIHRKTFPFLNISLFINNISPISDLAIENIAETDSGNVEIKINSDLSVFEEFSYTLDGIPAGKSLKVPLDNLKVNRAFLTSVTETMKAVIEVEVFENNEKNCSVRDEILVHPLEYFGGFNVLPELIASYITPNHPYVYHIKRKAIEIMEKQKLKTAFEGYQSDDSERVLQMMSAIYSAIQNEEIIYSALPPGYEQIGQRLRLLNTIRDERFGNCVDLSLLFAACLEAVDLNPIIVIVLGHAFVGCWLYDNKFAEAVNDDKSAITKRAAKGIREIALFEATAVCKGNNINFLHALNAGESQLIEKEDFILSVDIKRARSMGIRPLPLIFEKNNIQLDETTIDEEVKSSMIDKFEIGEIITEDTEGKTDKNDKLKIWERKLLDLSLRNNLLNIRMTRNMLQLVDIDINQLEDALADGKAFSIQPNPNAEIIKRYNLFAQTLHPSSPLFQMANEDLKYKRLHSYYHQTDLDAILTFMHKNAKLAIEENGSSTLYLAVGLLKWFDSKTPDRTRYAPILLLPVEISRRSVNSKFTLRSREEDTLLNITLIEFLRQEYQLNIKGLDPLPSDESGVDVAKVMAVIRRAVMQQRGWDVEEQLILGNFSFSKLILWKDIVMHHEELQKNPIVKSLIDGKLVNDEAYKTQEQKDLEDIHPLQITLPIPTDVSQMDAVLAAQNNTSFILHGPPGTGKSQTITNIIADALYRDKRVLFVAAKKAALDVVYNRIEQIGLAPFSLELHSNKSKKSDVLRQLSRSLELVRKANKLNFDAEAERLNNAKQVISNYVETLHEKGKTGFSLYDHINAIEEYKQHNFPEYTISETVLNELDATLWQKWQDWLENFKAVSDEIVHPSKNPFRIFTIKSYSFSDFSYIENQTKQLDELLRNAEVYAKEFFEAIDFSFEISTFEKWKALSEFAQKMLSLPDSEISFVNFLSQQNHRELYNEWVQHFSAYQTAIKSVLAEFNRNVLKEDATSLEIQWKKAQQSWFLPRWMGKNRVKKQLSIYKNNKIKSDDKVNNFFAKRHIIDEENRILSQNRFDELKRALNNSYKEEDTDLNYIRIRAENIIAIAETLSVFGHLIFATLLENFIKKGIQSTTEITDKNRKKIEIFANQSAELNVKLTEYETLTGSNFSQTESANWLHGVTDSVDELCRHLPNLKNWANYVHTTTEGEKLNLNWFVSDFERQVFPIEKTAEYFNFAVHSSLAKSVIARHQSLHLFNSALFENKIEQYKKIATKFRELTRQELLVKLMSRLPNITQEAMQSSEIGILQRAIRNNGRGMSIRRLFDQIPILLPRIAPCMLMSPISAAQYFDANTEHFDLVIFDEASQLPTCEAVSALARAKQAIIVGDPKQMPPTAFFTTSKIDEENIDIEDLESILDDCLALSIPSRYLQKHYRSKHESLIAFSNVNYYDSKLLTFPSADDISKKVIHHAVGGYYDKGKSRQNRQEAEAIVAFIEKHFSDKNRRKRSVGVVTFSQTQQNLVEELLNQLFAKNPEIETLANECEEPIFVKNLENVQGDERDIILFSICYAPDKDGKMSMNFGPINREGGWRRLNVAVTRARYEMHVFATLKSDLIDLSRTSSKGVAGLKSFLHYTETGKLPAQSETAEIIAGKEQIAKSMRDKLRQNGFEVRANIGTSGFRIDVGVVHPDNPHQYILGIILDGKYYYNAQTTNDREMVMPSVLKMLGWNIFRVWTLDWHENADNVIEKIVKHIEHLQKNNPKEEIKEVQQDERISLPDEVSNVQTDEDEIIIPASKQRDYENHYLQPVSAGSSEVIYEFGSKSVIERQISEIVDKEAPISKNLLFRKIIQAWNISRIGSRLDGFLTDIVNEKNFTTTHHHQPFYWSRHVNPDTLDFYRSNEYEKRNMEDIAPEEIKVAIVEAVQQNLSIEESELMRYTANKFGFAKVGKQIDTLLRYAINLAIKNNEVERENGRIRFKGE